MSGDIDKAIVEVCNCVLRCFEVEEDRNVVFKSLREFITRPMQNVISSAINERLDVQEVSDLQHKECERLLEQLKSGHVGELNNKEAELDHLRDKLAQKQSYFDAESKKHQDTIEEQKATIDTLDKQLAEEKKNRQATSDSEGILKNKEAEMELLRDKLAQKQNYFEALTKQHEDTIEEQKTRIETLKKQLAEEKKLKAPAFQDKIETGGGGKKKGAGKDAAAWKQRAITSEVKYLELKRETEVELLRKVKEVANKHKQSILPVEKQLFLSNNKSDQSFQALKKLQCLTQELDKKLVSNDQQIKSVEIHFDSMIERVRNGESVNIEQSAITSTMLEVPDPTDVLSQIEQSVLKTATNTSVLPGPQLDVPPGFCAQDSQCAAPPEPQTALRPSGPIPPAPPVPPFMPRFVAPSCPPMRPPAPHMPYPLAPGEIIPRFDAKFQPRPLVAPRVPLFPRPPQQQLVDNSVFIPPSARAPHVSSPTLAQVPDPKHHVPPRPPSTASSGNSSAAPAAGSGAIQKMMGAVKEQIPQATEEQIKQAVKKFRDSCPNKKITGFSCDLITRKVVEILSADLEDRSESSPTYVPNDCGASDYHRLAESDHSPDSRCSVCLDEMKEPALVKTLTCGHRFHEKCVQSWLSKTMNCPICRQLALSEVEYPVLTQ